MLERPIEALQMQFVFWQTLTVLIGGSCQIAKFMRRAAEEGNFRSLISSPTHTLVHISKVGKFLNKIEWERWID